MGMLAGAFAFVFGFRLITIGDACVVFATMFVVITFLLGVYLLIHWVKYGKMIDTVLKKLLFALVVAADIMLLALSIVFLINAPGELQASNFSIALYIVLGVLVTGVSIGVLINTISEIVADRMGEKNQ